MPYSFNPFTGNFNNVGSAITPLSANQWNSVYTTFQSNSSTYVKTTGGTTVPGTSAITMMLAVSALPASPDPSTLYIII